MSAQMYRVNYTRTSDNSQWVRFFSSHSAAKSFACKKQNEPGWRASWPVKVTGAATEPASTGAV